MITPFPAGGVATLRKIDDLLSGLGIIKTTLQYQRAKQEVFDIIRFELVADRQQCLASRRKRS